MQTDYRPPHPSGTSGGIGKGKGRLPAPVASWGEYGPNRGIPAGEGRSSGRSEGAAVAVVVPCSL